MPLAARLTDMHVCPRFEGPKPHVGGPILASGEPTVLIGMLPAARQGDTLICVGPPDTIQMGDPTVIIGNKPAARQGDPTQHGGVIVVGFPTVLIGMTPQAGTLAAAAAAGTPFCEECQKGGSGAE